MGCDVAAAKNVGSFAVLTLLAGGSLRRLVDCRCFQKTFGLLFQDQQRARFTLQFVVTCACFPEEGVALFGRAFECRVQQLIELLPLLGVHRHSRRQARGTARTWQCSSRVSRWRWRLSALRPSLPRSVRQKNAFR